MRRRLLVLLAAVTCAAGIVPVVGASAASAAPAQLSAVTVSGNAGEKPTITSDWPFSVRSSASEVRTEGTGAAKAVEGDRVTVDFVILNGRTGEEIQSSYGSGAQTLQLAKGTTPAIRKALVGATAGSRVLVAVAPEDGLTKQGKSAGLKKNDTVLFVVDVKDVTTPLTRATGTAVAPVAGLPTVTLAADGEPTITMPTTDASPTLIVQPLIVGDGPVVQAGQTIDVQYTGALYRSGKVFDSSWKGNGSVQFPIGAGQVIAGWDEGLVGQTVGSQVLLVIPPDKGYGAAGSPPTIKGTDTLVFVVDILSAT